VNDRSRAGSPWWRTHFDDTWFALHEPLFAPELSRREVAGIIELLGLPVGARVLDVPCGWGRHTDLLREAGYDAFGVDLSPALLRRAPRRRRGRSASFPYAAADIRRLPFRDATFDAAINVFTSLGLFASDREDVRALREIGRVLRPDGRLLLETMHRDEVVAAYAENDRWRLPDGTRVTAERRFDPVTGISHETWRWKKGRDSGERSHSLRLRTATEVVELVHRAGYHRIRCYGDWDDAPFDHRSASLILVANAPFSRLPDPAVGLNLPRGRRPRGRSADRQGGTGGS
jgi:SAM-dependent methyltransferase